jgi:hypothetical protein
LNDIIHKTKWMRLFGRPPPDSRPATAPPGVPRHDYMAESEALAHFFNFTRDDVAASTEDCEAAAGRPACNRIAWFVPHGNNPFAGGIHMALRVANYLLTTMRVAQVLCVVGAPDETTTREMVALAYPARCRGEDRGARPDRSGACARATRCGDHNGLDDVACGAVPMRRAAEVLLSAGLGTGILSGGLDELFGGGELPFRIPCNLRQHLARIGLSRAWRHRGAFRLRGRFGDLSRQAAAARAERSVAAVLLGAPGHSAQLL